MNRFLLFVFLEEQENGGMNDFINSFNTIEDALNHFNTMKLSKLETTIYQIYDMIENRFIKNGKK